MPLASGMYRMSSGNSGTSGDLRASPEYKKHLARVLTKRAIQQAQQ